MTFLSRLFSARVDPREALRPLWHRSVEIAREPEWYARCGVADTVEGRFDMITAVLALVMIRMERDEELQPRTALLAELFVEDMDGQLRQSGVGDLLVGKKIGRLMSTLGGRIGAYRDALEEGGPAIAAALKRNVTLADETALEALAARFAAAYERVSGPPQQDFLAGTIA